MTAAFMDLLLNEDDGNAGNNGTREWLMPIGNTGFWVTPNEPADPWDCDRYPNSPYCNGRVPIQPFLRRPNPFGFGLGFHRSECEVCVDLQPSLFGLPLPDYQICYRSRRDGCNNNGSGGGSSAGFSGAIGGTEYPPGCVQQTLWLEYIPSGRVFVNRPLPPPVAVLKPGTVFVSEPIAGIEFTTEDPDGMGGNVLLIAAKVRTISGAVATEYFSDGLPEYGYPRPVFLGTRLIDAQPPTCNYVPPPPSPPQPSGQYRDDDMCDCEETANLLRLIARRLGVQDYPVKVPKHLNRLGGDDDQSLESLTEFTAWFAYQMDALVGQFPIEIEIEDLDPTEEGNQGVKVKLPNVAETLAELYGLVTKSAINSDIHTNFLMRLAAEVIATKNSSLVTQDYVKANADFLGYQGTQKRRKIPYAFNPRDLSSLETILNSNEAEIVGWENTGKDTALEFFRELMFAAGIIKAVHYRRAADIARIVAELGSTLVSGEERQEQDDWEDFIQALNDPNNAFNRDSPGVPRVRDTRIDDGSNGGGQGGGR